LYFNLSILVKGLIFRWGNKTIRACGRFKKGPEGGQKLNVSRLADQLDSLAMTANAPDTPADPELAIAAGLGLLQCYDEFHLSLT